MIISSSAMKLLVFLLITSIWRAPEINGADTINTAVQAIFKSFRAEIVNSPVTLTEGAYPAWLRGSLLKNRCGTHGYLEGKSDFQVEHFWDCLTTCTVYKFKPIGVSYTVKYYETKPFYIWKDNDQDMSESGIAWYTKYSTMTTAKFKLYEEVFTDKIQFEPSNEFWRIGYIVYAVGDDYTMYVIDPNKCTIKREARSKTIWKNARMGLDDTWFFLNNPPVAPQMWDGSIWSATAAYTINSKLQGESKLMIYKIAPITYRIKSKGSLDYGKFDLTKCRSGGDYPDANEMMGYMGYMLKTVKHVVIPMSSMPLDVCNTFVYSKTTDPRPTYLYNYKWRSDKAGEIIIFKRNRRTFHHVKLSHTLFTSKGINAYEHRKKKELYLDMVTYANNSAWTSGYYLTSLFYERNQQQSNIVRYTFDTNDYTLKSEVTLKSGLNIDFPKIVKSKLGFKYTWAYFVINPFQPDCGLIKVDMRHGGTIATWYPGTDKFPEEPVIVRYPVPFTEDDCMLVSTGVDATDPDNPIGMVWIVKCKSLTLKAAYQTENHTPVGFGSIWIHYLSLPVDKTDDQLVADIAGGLAISAVVVVPIIVGIVFAVQN